MTHPLVIRRRLPRPFEAARIYASTEGGLRYLRPRMGRVDPILLRLAEELISPGDVVWDIGANLGLFSFAAAVAAGPDGYVLAVEPDIQLVKLLHRSTTVNHGHAPVDVVPAAVADDLGVSRFNIALRSFHQPSRRLWHEPNGRNTDHISCAYGDVGLASHTISLA